MNLLVTRNWTSVLFDLDGTILDSAPGILRSLKDTFANVGVPIPPDSELIHYVGPPLIDSLRNRAGFDEAKAAEVLALYRKDYRKDGIFDAAIFPGMVGLLSSLKDSGVSLALATSKPEAQALRALDHFELRQFFDVVAGATEDETRSSKADIIAHALEEMRSRGSNLEATVMVGDRIYDIEGAAANGVPTIIVEWGYGSPEEATGAMATVFSADRLRELLLG